mmetsp:Transcript_100830/g.194966  ORF Transcript_100830/g.194966 Transcript_100830/m.194966 type:complete len:202 (-) Transcript_100830:148-753(-)
MWEENVQLNDRRRRFASSTLAIATPVLLPMFPNPPKLSDLSVLVFLSVPAKASPEESFMPYGRVKANESSDVWFLSASASAVPVLSPMELQSCKFNVWSKLFCSTTAAIETPASSPCALRPKNCPRTTFPNTRLNERKDLNSDIVVANTTNASLPTLPPIVRLNDWSTEFALSASATLTQASSPMFVDKVHPCKPELYLTM